MVKTLMRFFVCVAVVVFISAPPQDVHAASLNPLHVEYLEGLIYKSGFFDNYLIYSSGDNATALVIGDLHCSGTVYTWSDALVYVIKTQDGVDSIDVLSDSSGSVNMSGLFGYSNVGNLPLIEGGIVYEKIMLLVLIIVFVFAFMLQLTRRSSRRV